MLLPVGYPVGHGVTVLQAAAQLTDVHTSPGRAMLKLWCHGQGDVLVALPASATRACLNGRRIGLTRARGRAVVAGRNVHVQLPGGEHTLTLEWR